ncbi:hypothetical protein TNCV_3028211 [Trichonephila clavipes]|nr:hypothetical protein TNCV_3028211 [Trichonephila clavipes]
MSSNTCQLREGEGESLTSVCVCVCPEGEACWNPYKMSSNQGRSKNILKHHINTGNSPSIYVPPYLISPVKNCPDCIKYKDSRSLPGYYRHLCQPNVLKPWPLISSFPYLRVKMVKMDPHHCGLYHQVGRTVCTTQCHS